MHTGLCSDSLFYVFAHPVDWTGGIILYELSVCPCVCTYLRMCTPDKGIFRPVSRRLLVFLLDSDKNLQSVAKVKFQT